MKINLLNEITDILNKYNLRLNDVKIIFNDEILKNDYLIEKLNVEYDNGWGNLNFKNIQIIIDDYTWFERTSYDGCEKFILKAHPIMSNYKNTESHTKYFYGGEI